MAPELASALRLRPRSGRRRRPSFWFDALGFDGSPRRPTRPPLRGVHRADVAIVGAGLAGLLVACALHDRRPGARIAVVEAVAAGAGGSGTATGSSSALDGVLASPELAAPLVARFRDGATALEERLAAWSVEADLRLGPAVAVASDRRGLARLGDALRAAGGVGDPRWLEAGEPSRRLVLRGVDAMLQLDAGLVLHPGRLVEGLVGRFEAGGGDLFEHSEVVAVGPGRVAVDGGRLDAATVVVAAGPATARLLPAVRPLVERTRTWHHLVTAPIDELSWERLGWAGGVQLQAAGRHGDERARRTPDDRLLWSWTPPRWRGVPRPLPAGATRHVRARLGARIPGTIPTTVAQGWSQTTVAGVHGPGHGFDRRGAAWWLVNAGDDPLESFRRALAVVAELDTAG